MIGVEHLTDILRIAVYSGALKGERPLSVYFITSVGGGKTEMLSRTQGKSSVKKVTIGRGKNARVEEVRQITGSVLYTTNTTPYKLYTRYGDILKSGQIKHIVIPDFLTVLNLPPYQMSGVVSFYNSLIEEGVISIESRDSSFVAEMPVCVGLLTGIAKQDFNKRRSQMAAMGFLSRALPVSWAYSDSTKDAILNSIATKEYLLDTNRFNITLPTSQLIDIPEKWTAFIRGVAENTKDPFDELGARRLKQLQVFCMANALMEGRQEVAGDDIKKLKQYERYFNYDCASLV